MWLRTLSTSTNRLEKCATKIQPVITDKIQSLIQEPSRNRELRQKRSMDNENPHLRAMMDLNSLQSNSQVLALSKYENPEQILPLFARQMSLANVGVDRLNDLNIIHVSGTKGKGSTCAFVEGILRGAGLKTGFYNSPHLIKVTERIRINGEPIREELFCQYFRYIFDKLTYETKRNNVPMPSYFSFLTILAFHIFLEERVDCAIMEVGIGGQYDPTNIVQKPIVCAITTLDYDHTNILGDTIEKIAKTKSGIAKTSVPVFTLKHEHETALKVIRDHTSATGSPLHVCNEFDDSQVPRLGISGRAQPTNASLACHIADYFLKRTSNQTTPESILEAYRHSGPPAKLTDFPSSFARSLESCSWAGRCQMIEFMGMKFFIDGAHTKKSMKNCLEWFLSISEPANDSAIRILMANVIGERDKREVLRPLSEYDGFDLVMFATNRINSAGDTPKSQTFVNIQSPNNEKSLENARKNAKVWRALIEDSGRRLPELLIMQNTSDSIREIHRLSRRYPGKEIHVLATGSLHFVGAVLETLPMIEAIIKE